MKPTDWAVNIPLKTTYRSVLLTIACRADADGCCEREMAKLCYECRIAYPQTMRKILARMEHVGLLSRSSRSGPGAKQVIRLHTDVEPKILAARIDADPYLSGVSDNERPPALDNARPAALDRVANARHAALDDPKLAPKSSADIASRTALDLETSADIASRTALVELGSPLNSLTPVVNSEEPEINHSELTPVGASPAAPAPARAHENDPPPAGKLIKLTDAQIAELALVYRTKDPDGEAGVRRRLGHFQNFEVSIRWRGDPLEAASAWLQRDYDKLPQRRNGTSAVVPTPEPPPRKSEFTRFNHGYRNY